MRLRFPSKIALSPSSMPTLNYLNFILLKWKTISDQIGKRDLHLSSDHSISSKKIITMFLPLRELMIIWFLHSRWPISSISQVLGIPFQIILPVTIWPKELIFGIPMRNRLLRIFTSCKRLAGKLKGRWKLFQSLFQSTWCTLKLVTVIGLTFKPNFGKLKDIAGVVTKLLIQSGCFSTKNSAGPLSECWSLFWIHWHYRSFIQF